MSYYQVWWQYFFLSLVALRRYNEALPHTSEKSGKNLNSLLLKVSESTVKESNQPLLYVFSYAPNPFVSQLIENFHNSSIQTILGDTRCLNCYNTNFHPKNIVFFVEYVSDILSIILDSVNEHYFEENARAEKYVLYCSNSTRNDYGSNIEKVYDPNTSEYCGIIGSINSGSDISNSSKRSPLFINDFELGHGSILSDDLYEVTRRLYSHDIWNSKNYLVFSVSNVNRHISRDFHLAANSSSLIGNHSHFDDLRVVFRFFWRFFKGLKSVVCFAEICFTYNPFTREIVHFTGLRDERYFNFSWPDFNGESFHILVPTSRPHGGGDTFTYWPLFWYQVLMKVTGVIADEKNCSITPIGDDVIIDTFVDISDFQLAQKFGIDILALTRGIGVAETEFSQYEFTTSMESYHLCLATPRAGFVPQSFAVFYSFSTFIWALIFAMILTFVCLLYLFLKLQVREFRSFYSEAALRSFETTSAVFTVYAYFLCGCPHRLLLGEFLTGKMIFIVFSFASIIIVTTFQGSMFRMLSNYVRYPEVDTLEEFTRTNLFIQVPDTASYSRFLENVPLFKGEKKRLSDTYFFLKSILYETLDDNWDLWVDIFNIKDPRDENPISELGIDPAVFNKSAEMKKFVTAAVETDAFLVTIPHTLLSARNIELQSFVSVDWFELHRVEECLNSYSLAFRFPKHNFFYEDVNHKVVQILETGLLKRMMEEYLTLGLIDFKPSPIVDWSESGQ
ncbi:unnamed protein product [Bemisia tabaci]|uniref:Ionotropic receptor n=1 Tax=Bemisia tabaci TaxID=7038 RepID=A0A9P0F0I7_BEMTA|nr:unnamed protein product [Bemisia tabaci]